MGLWTVNWLGSDVIKGGFLDKSILTINTISHKRISLTDFEL